MNHMMLPGSNWWWKVDGRRLASNRNDGVGFRPLSSKFKAKLEYVSPVEWREQLWESQDQWIYRLMACGHERAQVSMQLTCTWPP